MPKDQRVFECQACGTRYPKWQGKCDQCSDWNSLLEIKPVAAHKHKSIETLDKQSKPLSAIEPDPISYYKTGIHDVDHVLGQGLVKGSVVLLGGEPGIGKSTLALQVCQHCALTGLKVLYVSAEESEAQLKLRAQRLQPQADSVWVYAQTNMSAIINECDRIQPDIILLDSIQVVHHPDLSALEGTVSQVRHCASTLIQWVKQHNKSAIMIGHITKDGHIAGPKVLEHLVDVILYLEGDRHFFHRILRCHKNRFGSTDNSGIFDMKEHGLEALPDHAQAFIESSQQDVPGSVIVPYAEGSRILLIEVQALVVATGYGMGKRNFVGVNPNRAQLLIAALDKLFSLKLGGYDIFLKVIGGLSVSDPSVDLGIMVAIISSLRQLAVRSRWAVCGEVGLTGEIRSVSYIEKRILELKKNGFEGCYIPTQNAYTSPADLEFTVHHIEELTAVFRHIFSQNNDSKKPKLTI